ncbi:MAG: SUMF1/EgtB/PvdO family nonheme iron enzyme [Myxococcota bacterium]
MLCYRCGSYNADDARKCTVCGAPLSTPRRPGASKGKVRARRHTGRSPLEPGHLVGARYRVIDSIAQGTTGWVFRARDEDENADVALKLIAPNLLQTDPERAQFAKALKSATKLRHVNIVRILSDGRDRGQAYYAMPYLEGLTLRKIIDLRIEKKQTFNLSEVLPLISQLAQATDAWGRFGYHGAIRPTSVVVLPDVLKITGLPHLQGLPRKPFVVFQQQAGAIEYLAPEARREDALVDRRADIYSIAVIFAEMLTGAVFGRDERLWKQAEASLAPALVAVLHKALADTANARFETGQKFFESLANTVSEFGDEEGTTPGVPVEVFDDNDPREAATQSAIEPTKMLDDDAQPERLVSSRRKKSIVGGQPRRGLIAAALVLFLAGSALAGAVWYRNGSTDERPSSDRATELLAEVEEPPAKVEPVTKNDERTDEPSVKRAKIEPKPARTVLPPKSAEKETPAPAVAKNPTPKAVATKRSTRDAPKTPEAKKPVVASLAPAPPPSIPIAPKASGPADVCPKDMIRIDSGRFLMGTQPNDPMRGFGDLQVRYRTTESYCIDRFEYPNRKGSAPETGVTWARAKTSCESRGKRLCSEVEWERACKGPKNARFPFGNAFKSGACNIQNGGRPRASGSYGGCTSGYGVKDMAGNVAEWTASRWSSEIPDRVVKGGAADQAMHASRCSARINEVAGSRGQQLGFRCCASLD